MSEETEQETTNAKPEDIETIESYRTEMEEWLATYLINDESPGECWFAINWNPRGFITVKFCQTDHADMVFSSLCATDAASQRYYSRLDTVLRNLPVKSAIQAAFTVPSFRPVLAAHLQIEHADQLSSFDLALSRENLRKLAAEIAPEVFRRANWRPVITMYRSGKPGGRFALTTDSEDNTLIWLMIMEPETYDWTTDGCDISFKGEAGEIFDILRTWRLPILRSTDGQDVAHKTANMALLPVKLMQVFGVDEPAGPEQASETSTLYSDDEIDF